MDPLSKAGLPPGLAVSDALPLLFSAGRTGRLSAREADGPELEVWIEQGRVTHAAWGPLRALSALEMAALLPPKAECRFEDGQRAENRTLDLSAIDVWARLAEVSRAGGKLATVIPGIEAVPRLTGHRPRTIEPDTTRVLEQIDGERSVAQLANGRQPLAVVRGLASLVGQGAVSFGPDEIVPAPEPLPPPVLVREPPPPPPPPPPVVPEAEPDDVESPRQAERPWRFPLNVGLAALALVIAVGLWFAIQRQGSESGSGAQPAATRVIVAAAQPTAASTPVPPTPVPTQAAPTPVPTQVPAATALPATQAPPTQGPTATQAPPTPAPATPAPATAVPPSPAPLLDQTFASAPTGWPNSATSSAFWDPSGYHLVPRIASQYVAVTAPNTPPLTNGTVNALFRKLGGPDGGGYGLILRAQGALDGGNQVGRFYVFEVGDKGEVGAWRREQNQWIDLVPWQAASAVRPGVAENRLEVRAAGPQFTFSVNDAPVAEISDATLPSGAVGVFTGGDGNEVVLERFTVASD